MADALHTTGVVSAQEARVDDGGLIAVHGPTALDARTGVLFGPGATTVVTGTSATAPMTVNIAAHHWVSTRGSANGPYRGAAESTKTVNIAAAPGSGTRIDVVYVKMQDNTAGVPTPDGAVGELYGVLQGTAGAGKPSLATIVGAEELATVSVSAGATSTNGAGVTITNTARLTVARGAPIPVRNQTERDALTLYTGIAVKRLDAGGVEERYSGSAWVRDPTSTDLPATWPVAALRQNSAQTFPTGFWQTIAFDLEDIDTASGHSTSTNTSRWTCPSGQAGTYRVEGGVAFGSMANGLLVNSRIVKNGVPTLAMTGSYGVYGGSGGTGVVTGAKLLTLAVGDYVELQGYVNSGGWSTSVFESNACWLNLDRIR